MTNKIQRTAGTDFEEITIEGETYKMSPLKYVVYGEMEAYVCSLRTCPIEAVANSPARLTKVQQQAAFDAAIRAATFAKIVPATEMANFEKSVTGIAYKLWKSLEPNHPEIDSVDKAAFLLTIAGAERLEEIKAKLFVASGESSLKK